MTSTTDDKVAKQITATQLKIATAILGLVGAACLGALGWLLLTAYNMSITVTRLETTIAVVKPADVLRAVQDVKSDLVQVERKQLTAKDVRDIVKADAPWYVDKPAWEQWKYEKDRTDEEHTKQLDKLQRQIEDILRQIKSYSEGVFLWLRNSNQLSRKNLLPDERPTSSELRWSSTPEQDGT